VRVGQTGVCAWRSGKSALIQRLFAQNAEKAFRVPAHRPNYFNTERPSMSSQERANTGTNIQNANRQDESRWLDHNSLARPSISLFGLIDSENRNSRQIAHAFKADDDALLGELKKLATPLEVLNRLFRLANINIAISISDRDSRVLATRPGGMPYAVARLSDGERNATAIRARGKSRGA
jgi:hypothetical protein